MKVQVRFATMALFLSLGLQSCWWYSFQGGDTGTAETIAVHFFDNKAPIVVPELSQLFTQELRDKFRNESRLAVTNDKGDWDLSGYISRYQTTFLAVQNDQPAKTRLEMTVQVTFINSKEESKNFDKPYSQYVDFDSDEELSNIESDLIEELSERIAIDIFNDTVNNW